LKDKLGRSKDNLYGDNSSGAEDSDDGNLSDEVLREFKLMSERDQAVAKARLEN
jgi:hypothetical protein